jgi:hypothetical protein
MQHLVTPQREQNEDSYSDCCYEHPLHLVIVTALEGHARYRAVTRLVIEVLEQERRPLWPAEIERSSSHAQTNR